jgi:phosphocarrier protein FPr/phosphocarrier protein
VTRLVAPLSGWLAPLSEVSDPVFASGSMGSGFAIDPIEGLVTAPCDGTIAAVAPTRHSVTIETDDGVTLLIHVGLDTVALKGDGFELLVEAGARVRSGDLLIRFDLNHVALNARSLMTPVLAIGEGDTIAIPATGQRIARGEPVGEVSGSRRTAVGPIQAGVERTVTLAMPNGIHARPAARIVTAAKPFAADIELRLADRRASARSTVALLKLAAKHGDVLTVAASGPDAPAAADTIVELIASGMGEEHGPIAAPATAAPPATGTKLPGVSAAPGLAIGVAAHFGRAEIAVPRDGQGIAHERAALAEALATVHAGLAKAAGASAGIAQAHQALLDDPELLAATEIEIAAGRSAAFAWRSATREAGAALTATGDPLLAERVGDLMDLEWQVAALLTGATARPQALPPDAILIADDLLPSEFQALDRARLAGVALAGGGPTSHVAVLAASAGVPMLVALGPTIRDVAEAAPLILDAERGLLDTAPDALALSEAAQRLSDRCAARAEARIAAGEDARTADGVRIEVFANLGSVDEAGPAVGQGAEGCGLLRTEFLFLDRQSAPDEDEQARIYGGIAAALGDRPLIVRTFDIGGDKPVTYLPMAAEDNPALGVRGVRLNLLRSDLLDTQLRAIVRGVPAAQRRIMVPMIVELSELRQVRDRLRAVEAGLGVTDPTPIGVMVETPSAALLAGIIAAEADFLSVGSNDLTQYALACDRGNPATAVRIDALHPAVLRLIALTAEGAAAHGKWLGVCGSVASDPEAAALLVGLGATELSVAPGQIAAVKARIRRLALPACRALAQGALACADAAEVRALLKETSG